MAERMKEQLLEEELVVDLIAGPDSYRELPGLLLQSLRGSG
jgi:tRNA-2-methylthio-N6-dimethylallyladenosine synthase